MKSIETASGHAGGQGTIVLFTLQLAVVSQAHDLVTRGPHIQLQEMEDCVEGAYIAAAHTDVGDANDNMVWVSELRNLPFFEFGVMCTI